MQRPRQLIRKTTLAFAAALIAVSISPIEATTVSTVPLYDTSNAPNGVVPVGEGMTSTIIRDPGGVTVNVHTNTEPGAYTVWLVIWNDPSRCMNAGPPSRCLPPPAGGSDIPDSVIFGSGQVVPSSGRGDFAVRLAVGDTSRIIGGRERAGLTNVMGAEIHVVVRSHGTVLTDALEAQITTFEGGCDVNLCRDLQAGPHAPGDPNGEITRLDAIKALLERIAVRGGLRP